MAKEKFLEERKLYESDHMETFREQRFVGARLYIKDKEGDYYINLSEDSAVVVLNLELYSCMTTRKSVRMYAEELFKTKGDKQ